MLTIVINLIMSSAFAAILIYAMELMPGRIGLVGGLFYGLSFGLGGLAAAMLGELADRIGIDAVYHLCAFLPAIGLLAWFLPRLAPKARPPGALTPAGLICPNARRAARARLTPKSQAPAACRRRKRGRGHGRESERERRGGAAAAGPGGAAHRRP